MCCLVLTEYSPHARSACRPRELHSEAWPLLLTWCSPRADSVCRRHEPCSKGFRYLSPNLSSRHAHSACPPRELHSKGSCLSLIWCSPRADSGCRRHEPCSKECGRLLASCSPQRRSVRIFHGCHVGLGVLRTASRGGGVASHSWFALGVVQTPQE
eukprot:6269381-Pyramimonas_sp.AAC.1